ncbi:putative nuclease HARBI1 [Heterodontus francisci]|uniref:putative nuclease HARBI1 n=1 Tax=Heterodontus francisci TaxID=7792 RepID=UPI00355C2C14
MCEISQSAPHHCIKEVTNAFFRRANDDVHFRMDPKFQAERSIKFEAITGFPQVWAVIDGTHMAIKAPVHQPVAFINRKGFHYLNLQLVCDHCKWILQGWIPGDMGYPLRTCLPMAVRRPCTDAEEKYNMCHGTTRASIEQATSLLKMRFRFLDRSGGALQYALRGEALNNKECGKHTASSSYENAEEEAGQVSPDEGPQGQQERRHEIGEREARDALMHSHFLCSLLTVVH